MTSDGARKTGQRARRVLHGEVPVRDEAALHRVSVAAVDLDVDDLASARADEQPWCRSRRPRTEAAAPRAVAWRPLLRSVGIAPWENEREHHEGEYPRQIEIEPMRQHELGGEQDRGRQRGELERPSLSSVARPRQGRARRRRAAASSAPSRGRARPRRGTAPSPRRERRVPVELEADRAVPKRPHGVPQVGLEEEHAEYRRGRRDERGGEAGCASGRADRPDRRARAEPRATQRTSTSPPGRPPRRGPTAR